MMQMKDGYIIVSMHDFKTNLSRYLRMLQRGEARALVLRRYRRRIAMLVPFNAPPARTASPAETV